jgi:type II secretory pathway pseudopilin PulG
MKKPTTYHLPPTTYRSKSGFTILELLIFSAIFALIMISFITILVTIIRVQSRQSAAAQVNQESQFLLQQVQYYIERSSLVEMDQDVVTSTLKLRMAAGSEDPTLIYLSGGRVYIQQSSTAAQALTTSRVNVTSLVFTKRSNAPSHDSVSVSFMVVNNTQNMTQQFSQALQTAIARVSAATFDSNVIPSSTAGLYSLGTGVQYWNSVNGVINFSGSNVSFTGYVGIGVSPPTQLLQVGGGSTVGDIYVGYPGNGIILKNTNNVCVRLFYAPTGQLATSSVPCT